MPKVLIIEDNIVNAKLLTVFLQEAQFEVVHAEDSDAALLNLKADRDISVILLDRMLPNMDGLQLLMSFKRSPEIMDIPVIMLTAAMSPVQIADAKLMGAYACLPKPYNKDKIVETINAALRYGR